jgi:hypothetical protein
VLWLPFSSQFSSWFSSFHLLVRYGTGKTIHQHRAVAWTVEEMAAATTAVDFLTAGMAGTGMAVAEVATTSRSHPA